MKILKAEYSHIGGRRENEDFYGCETAGDRLTAVVADGLGGHGGGSTASRIAVRNLMEARRCTALPTKEQILQWMKSANAEIIARRETANRMKTTAVFLAAAEDQAIWAHVGDSRMYHFYNGVLADYTLDHSVSQIQVVSGEITREQIPSSPNRNKVLRVLGSDELNPEVHEPIRLRPGVHAFLMCTDGFWEYLTDMEIWLDLMKSRTPEDWLTYLRCRGESRKGPEADNNTAVAVFIEV